MYVDHWLKLYAYWCSKKNVCASRNPTSPHHASALQAERAGLLSDWIVALLDCWVDGLLGRCAVRLFGCCAVGLYGRVSVTIFNRKWIQNAAKMVPKWCQNRSGQGLRGASEPNSEQAEYQTSKTLTRPRPFEAQSLQNGAKSGPKIDPKRVYIRCRNRC